MNIPKIITPHFTAFYKRFVPVKGDVMKSSIVQNGLVENYGNSFVINYPSGFGHLNNETNIEVDSSLFVQLCERFVNGEIHKPAKLVIGNGYMFGTHRTPYLTVADQSFYNVLYNAKCNVRSLWLFHVNDNFLSIHKDGPAIRSLDSWKNLISHDLVTYSKTPAEFIDKNNLSKQTSQEVFEQVKVTSGNLARILIRNVPLNLKLYYFTTSAMMAEDN